MSGKSTAPERLLPHVWELKEIDAEGAGSFTGHLAVFGNVDSYNDVIQPGAFKKTLSEAKAKGQRTLYPLLWQHDPSRPIGSVVEAREDAKGLFIKGQIDTTIEDGKRAYNGMKQGYVSGLSIGYVTMQEEYKGDVRHLKEIRLMEASVVTFPANNEARVDSVKGVSGSTDWPLADRGHGWDAGAANQRLQGWAKSGDGIDLAKWASVHFWSPEGDARQNISEYKLPFCDVIEGSVKAVPQAVIAVKQRLGGTDIPDAAKSTIMGKVNAYYKKMGMGEEDQPAKADPPLITIKIDDEVISRYIAAHPEINTTGVYRNHDYTVTTTDHTNPEEDKAGRVLSGANYERLCHNRNRLKEVHDDIDTLLKSVPPKSATEPEHKQTTTDCPDCHQPGSPEVTTQEEIPTDDRVAEAKLNSLVEDWLTEIEAQRLLKEMRASLKKD